MDAYLYMCRRTYGLTRMDTAIKFSNVPGGDEEASGHVMQSEADVTPVAAE